MNILFILLVISSVVILLLNVLLFWSITAYSKMVGREAEAYRQEMRDIFGWNTREWAHNFRLYQRDAKQALERVTELEELNVIKEAKKLQQLKSLERQKESVDRELKRLTND